MGSAVDPRSPDRKYLACRVEEIDLKLMAIYLILVSGTTGPGSRGCRGRALYGGSSGKGRGKG